MYNNNKIEFIKEFLKEIGFDWEGNICVDDKYSYLASASDNLSPKKYAVTFFNKEGTVAYFCINEKNCILYNNKYKSKVLKDYSREWRDFQEVKRIIKDEKTY